MQQPPYPPNGYPSNPGYPPTTGQYPPTYPGQTPPPGYPLSSPNYPPMPPGYPQPPMQQPPVKKKSKKGLIIGGIIIGALVLCGIIATSTHGATAPTNTTSFNINSSQQAAPTQPPAPTQAPQTWQTTHTFTGNGNQKTAIFTVGDDWKINWSCTPSSFDGIAYNVIVDVDNSDGSYADPGAINATCQTSTPNGTTEEHQGGTVYLDIQSEAAWTVTVQELK